MEELVSGLVGKGLVSMKVEDEEEAQKAAGAMASRRVVPVMAISNVSGLHLDLLYTFLNHLPQLEPSMLTRHQQQLHLTTNSLPLFYVEEVFRKSDSLIGGDEEGQCVIVCGILAHGVVHEGEEIQLGPTGKTGRYLAGKVESIHRNKQPVMRVTAGQAASLALR